MLAGSEKYFTSENFRNSSGFSTPELAELAVHCLELVSQLSRIQIPFRFKGGNSLLLLLKEPGRFSIDVDIATAVPREKLTAAVEQITEECPAFTRCEIRPHKTKPWLPMISYKIYFNSRLGVEQEPFVMLDAVLEPSPYPGMRVPVRCMDLYSSDYDTEVSTVDSLIADKLLTLGPSTLGIPVGKNKEAQRLKHIFDVARLLHEQWSLDPVLSALEAGINQENTIQKSSWEIGAVAEDTLMLLEQPARFPERPGAEHSADNLYLAEIMAGFDGFRTHLFGTAYDWHALQEDCAIITDLIYRIQERANP